MTTTVNTYHFRIWTGPTTVAETAKRLTANPKHGATVTVVGTEHVHVAVPAPDPDKARDFGMDWWTGANVGTTRVREWFPFKVTGGAHA